MARRKTRQQKIFDCKVVLLVIIFAVIVGCLNIISFKIYGVNLQIAPIHDSPKQCEQRGYQVCTTRIGTCTKNKKQCISPQKSEQCKYISYHANWDQKQYFKTHPKVEKDKLTDQQIDEIRYRYENYCGSPQLSLYNFLSQDWIIMLILQIILASIVFAVVYPEVKQCAEWWIG